MKRPNELARIEFSRSISTPIFTEGMSEKEAVFTIEADAAECTALAERFDLKGLGPLRAELRFTPDRNGLLRLEGRLMGEVVQVCVVTLTDVTSSIDERFSLRFSLEGPSQFDRGEISISIDEEDPPDPLVAETIDLGEVVAEQLALALDPYPRVPGATFSYTSLKVLENEEVNSSFRRLVSLKDGK